MNCLRIFFIAFLLIARCYCSEEMIIKSVTRDGNKLTALFSKKLVESGYLKQPSISIEYSGHIDLNALSSTIINVPFVMMIAPIAWFSGDTWTIDEMDYDLYNSLEKVKSVMKFFYPELKWSGKIIPKKLVKNSNEVNHKLYDRAMLFSSGVDSTSTAISRDSERQLLINLRVWKETHGTGRFKKQITSFAHSIHSDVSFVYSNYYSVINQELLSKLCKHDWMVYIGFGLSRLGMAAPIAIYNKIPKLLISATSTSENPEPYGSHPLIDNALLIAGTKVVHEGAYNRSKKLYNIATYCFKNKIHFPKLQVCMRELTRGTNCLKCEQCLFTMNNILASEIDPKLFGFGISKEKIIQETQKYLSNKSNRRCFQWIDLQNFVRNKSFNDEALRKHFLWISKFSIICSDDFFHNDEKKRAIFKDYFIRSINGTFDYSELSS